MSDPRLPPGCNDNDPDAPWNDNRPDECPMCGGDNYNLDFEHGCCSDDCVRKFKNMRDDAMIAHWESLHESRYC